MFMIKIINVWNFESLQHLEISRQNLPYEPAKNLCCNIHCSDVTLILLKIDVCHIPPWLNFSMWILLHLLNVKHWKYLFLKFSPSVWHSSIHEYMRSKQKKLVTITGLTALLTSVINKELEDSWKDTAALGHTWSLTKTQKSYRFQFGEYFIELL